MDTYRVFISYSHEDKGLVEKIVKALEANGLIHMWDKNFLYGLGFHEQIKNFIAHAHVFIPFITEASSKRGWVHQEIGYAMALNVPILPVTLDKVPGEMIQQLLAVQLSDDFEILKKQLSKEIFTQLVERAQKTCKPLFECAEYREDRTTMMVEYATKVLDLGLCGEVRQKGGLTSFHIPDKPVLHQDWKYRYGSLFSEHRCLQQRKERQVLEKHAKVSGCRLIIYPYLTYEIYGTEARKSRIEGLIKFLESVESLDERVVVAFSKPEVKEHYLTIVGDWFAAESISSTMGEGIRQTIFTRHAPSVRSRIDLFDQEFNFLLEEQKYEGHSSRMAAIAKLNEILADLEKKQRQ